MRIQPILPDNLNPELRRIHDEIVNQVTKSQSQVNMLNSEGALLGPFPPMLQFPKFGVPALNFIRTLDTDAILQKHLREVAILTVAGVLGARFELYAHEIMAATFGLSSATISSLAAGSQPHNLTEQETIAHDIAYALANGRTIPNSTYNHSIALLGQNGTAELIFLISGYCLIAMILNGFDIPAPDYNTENQ